MKSWHKTGTGSHRVFLNRYWHNKHGFQKYVWNHWDFKNRLSNTRYIGKDIEGRREKGERCVPFHSVFRNRNFWIYSTFPSFNFISFLTTRLEWRHNTILSFLSSYEDSQITTVKICYIYRNLTIKFSRLKKENTVTSPVFCFFYMHVFLCVFSLFATLHSLLDHSSLPREWTKAHIESTES